MPDNVADSRGWRLIPPARELHPWLAASAIVTHLAARNTKWITLADLSLVLGLSLVATAGLFLVYRLIRQSSAHAALLTTLSIVAFCLYGALIRELKGLPIPPGLLHGVLITGLALILGSVWRAKGDLRRLAACVSLTAALIFGNAGFQLLTDFSRIPPLKPDPLLASAEQLATARAVAGDRPDIYYIILDGYGREDILKDHYGFDNGEFLQGLRDRGFYIADQSCCNYPMTYYSLSSSLSMRYHDPIDPRAGLRPFSEMVRSNQVGRLLKECGYRIVHFNTNYIVTGFSRIADVSLGSQSRLPPSARMLVGTLRQNSALACWDGVARGAFAARHRQALDQLADIPKLAGPKFTFLHLIAPHPPYVYDRDGNPRRDLAQTDRQSYIDQLIFVNREITHLVDIIRRDSRVPPIILIQADHGPGFFSTRPLVPTDDDQQYIHERIPILNAYLVPNRVRERLYPTITPVNSFRLLLSECLGLNLPLLPDREFIMHMRDWSNMAEVTKQVVDGYPSFDITLPPTRVAGDQAAGGSRL